MSVLTDIIHFLLITSFSMAIISSAILFYSRNSKRSMAICIYFLVQMALELIIRNSEVESEISRAWNNLFIDSIAIKGICYIIVMITMLMTLLVLIEVPLKWQHFIAPVLIGIYLLIMPSIQSKNMLFYCIYLLPCEMFYLGLAIYALRKLKTMPDIRLYAFIRKLVIITAVMAVIIAIEDIATAYSYGFFTEFTGFTIPSIGESYIKERSYSESAYVFILAVMSIYVCSRSITETLRQNLQAVAPEVVAEQFVEAKPETKGEYAEFIVEYGLSAREGELLPLLLKNRSIQKISEELFISPGTVKTHTHNIYQKTGAVNRSALIEMVEDYYSEK